MKVREFQEVLRTYYMWNNKAFIRASTMPEFYNGGYALIRCMQASWGPLEVAQAKYSREVLN